MEETVVCRRWSHRLGRRDGRVADRASWPLLHGFGVTLHSQPIGAFPTESEDATTGARMHRRFESCERRRSPSLEGGRTATPVLYAAGGEFDSCEGSAAPSPLLAARRRL